MIYVQRKVTGRSSSSRQARYLAQDPGHRLLREEVVPHVRYRVTREGWDSVAERAVTYNV